MYHSSTLVILSSQILFVCNLVSCCYLISWVVGTILLRYTSILSVTIQPRTQTKWFRYIFWSTIFLVYFVPLYDVIYNDLLLPILMYVFFASDLLKKVGKHSEFEFSLATLV